MFIGGVDIKNDKARLVLLSIIDKQGVITSLEKKELDFLGSKYMLVDTEESDIIYWLKEKGFIDTADPEYIVDSLGVMRARSLLLRKLKITDSGREALSKLFHSELKDEMSKKRMEWIDRLFDFKTLIAIASGFLLREIFSLLEVVWKFLLSLLTPLLQLMQS